MLRLLTLLFLTVCAVTASAGQVIQIYRAETLVATQSVAERNDAMKVGLQEVILRVSGDETSLENPLVRDALSQAQNYLYEFSYASTDDMLQVEERQVPAIRLILKYSPSSIDKLLRDANLPLWPANRPTLLIWQIMKDNNGDTYRVMDEESHKALYRQAGLRGLPLLMPLHDLEDNLALSNDELWAQNEERVRVASERYKADAILVGRYNQLTDGSWESSWQLLHTSGNQHFEPQSADTAGIFTQVINATADYFARLYAIAPGEGGAASGEIVMRVDGVTEFSDYKDLERYLTELAITKRVDLISIERDKVLVRLHTAGDLALLQNMFELGKKLHPVVSDSVALQPVQTYRPEASSTENWQQPVETDLNGYPSANSSSASVNAKGTLANPLVYRWAS